MPEEVIGLFQTCERICDSPITMLSRLEATVNKCSTASCAGSVNHLFHHRRRVST